MPAGVAVFGDDHLVPPGLVDAESAVCLYDVGRQPARPHPGFGRSLGENVRVDEPAVATVREPRKQVVGSAHGPIVRRFSDTLCQGRPVEFSVTSLERDSRTIVTVVGDLDVHTAPTLQEHLGPLTSAQGVRLIIDLSSVAFIDSTGLGILVGALKHVREVGGTLHVVVTSPRVLKVFTLTGLDAVIAVYPDLVQALD